jgi:hypothetical protein
MAQSISVSRTLACVKTKLRTGCDIDDILSRVAAISGRLVLANITVE